MVDVAQGTERLVVTQEDVGASPTIHPKINAGEPTCNLCLEGGKHHLGRGVVVIWLLRFKSALRHLDLCMTVIV